MAPPACTTILTWVENSKSLGNVENSTGRKRPQLKGRLRNRSILTSTSTQQRPWKKWLQIQWFPTSPYKISWKAGSLVSVQSNESTSVTITRYAQLLAFSQSCMDNISSDSGFFLDWFYWWLCVSRLWIGKPSEHSNCSKEKAKDSKTWVSQRKLAVWCAVYANNVIRSCQFSNETKKSIIFKSCIITLLEKLNNLHRILFSSKMQLLLTLNPPPFLFWIKRF